MTTCALKVMQIYSGRQGAEIAAAVCGRLRQDLAEGQFHETGWNTELLRSAKLRSMAAREAAEADLVLVVMDEGSELSAEIAGWLRLWRRRNASKGAKLLALLRRETFGAGKPVQTALQRFARARRMDFVCHSRVDLRSLRCSDLPRKLV